MRRSDRSVGVTLGIACICIVVSASAQPKKPKKGAAAAATAAPTAVAASPPSAKPHPNPKSGHPGHDPKKPVTDEPKAPETDTSHAPPTGHQVVERESHIEFDERMVRGQSAAGAIYLFNRQPNEFKSIVKVPETFRPRTVALVAPRGGTP